MMDIKELTGRSRTNMLSTLEHEPPKDKVEEPKRLDTKAKLRLTIAFLLLATAGVLTYMTATGFFDIDRFDKLEAQIPVRKNFEGADAPRDLNLTTYETTSGDKIVSDWTRNTKPDEVEKLRDVSAAIQLHLQQKYKDFDYEAWVVKVNAPGDYWVTAGTNKVFKVVGDRTQGFKDNYYDLIADQPASFAEWFGDTVGAYPIQGYFLRSDEVNPSIVLTPAGMSFDTIVQGIGTTGQGVVVLYAPDVPITPELIDKWINIFPKKGSYTFQIAHYDESQGWDKFYDGAHPNLAPITTDLQTLTIKDGVIQ